MRHQHPESVDVAREAISRRNVKGCHGWSHLQSQVIGRGSGECVNACNLEPMIGLEPVICRLRISGR
jgi:hypothetical protein